MLPPTYHNYEYHLAIGWKNSKERVPVSTASVSMINGDFVFSGVMAMLIKLKSQIITHDYEEQEMSKRELEPIHPGEILLEEFLNPMDISQYRLAKDINVDPRRINEIVHGKRAISTDTAMRLGHFFGMSPQFWLNLQSHYALELLDMQSGDQIQNEVKVLA